MYLYKKKNGKKFDLKIARYRGIPYSGWTYQSETTLLSCLNSLLRISSANQRAAHHGEGRVYIILVSMVLFHDFTHAHTRDSGSDVKASNFF